MLYLYISDYLEYHAKISGVCRSMIQDYLAAGLTIQDTTQRSVVFLSTWSINLWLSRKPHISMWYFWVHNQYLLDYPEYHTCICGIFRCMIQNNLTVWNTMQTSVVFSSASSILIWPPRLPHMSLWYFRVHGLEPFCHLEYYTPVCGIFQVHDHTYLTIQNTTYRYVGFFSPWSITTWPSRIPYRSPWYL